MPNSKIRKGLSSQSASGMQDLKCFSALRIFVRTAALGQKTRKKDYRLSNIYQSQKRTFRSAIVSTASSAVRNARPPAYLTIDRREGRSLVNLWLKMQFEQLECAGD
ncbi:hypothetical protein KT71_003269 [Congregibacter litoralis KT71]|uniref:Uncharacterized protein n=1 Tax=Congregibacter litoralis KT71 TaxID=314285 RepID=V7HVG8_9GAMM|nr:hypothetical protein KT71_003269 [Congregibacter litoralis KT71]